MILVTNEMKQKCPYYELKCDDIVCECPKYAAFLDMQDENIVNQELEELNVAGMDNWSKIFNIQKHFAQKYHPIENIPKEITDIWVKEYCICIEDEVEELMDYISWDGKPVLTDDTEMRKEIIDILHFMMDVMIVSGCTPEEIKKNYIEKYVPQKNIKEDFFTYAFNHERKLFCFQNNINMNENIKSGKHIYDISDEKFHHILLNLTLKVLYVNRILRQYISWKHWKKANKVINYEKLHDACTLLFKRFIILCTFVFANPQEIIDIYIRKNIENIRRQKHGY